MGKCIKEIVREYENEIKLKLREGYKMTVTDNLEMDTRTIQEP